MHGLVKAFEISIREENRDLYRRRWKSLNHIVGGKNHEWTFN